MITVSDKYKESLKNGNRNFQVNSTLKLTDGTVLPITNACLWSGGFVIDDSVSEDSVFQIGSAIINQCTIILNNIYDDYTDYDFYGATLSAFVGMEFDDGTTEYMRKGEFIVVDPQYNGSLITLTCYDNMYFLDKTFDISVDFPITAKELVNRMCLKCGIILATLDFPHSSYQLQKPSTLENTTYRTILMWICQICGCFARFNTYGELEIKWFNQSALDNPSEHQSEIHSIQSSFEKELATDDVVITGVQITEVLPDGASGDAQTYLSGTDGYVVSIENNDFLYDGLGEEVAAWLGNQLSGLRFRSGQITHISDPTIEAGDVVLFTDEKEREYKLIVSGTTYTLNNSQTTRSSAETPARNSSQRYSNDTRNYVKAREEIKREATEREKALEALNKRIDNAEGFYTTEETDSAGGKIFYMHNKPTLAESNMAWKMTAEAIAVATEKDSSGNFIWSAGIMVNGDVIARILNAAGVNADWINTGAITVRDKDGNILFNVDIDSKTVQISGAAVVIGNKSVEEITNSVIVESTDQYYQSNSPTALTGGSWSTTAPSWESGKYVFRRTYVVYGDNSTKYVPSEYGICITGNTGAKGQDGTNGTNGSNGQDGKTVYATCSSAAGTVAKVATVSGSTNFSLTTGATVSVTFSNNNSAATPTLNVNGTGAKPIYVFGSPIAAVYYWVANSTVQFTYDGSHWVMSDNVAMALAADWCYANDRTYINGAKLFTGTVGAKQINVTDLFAQNIEANNMHLSGNSSIDGEITAKSLTLGDGKQCKLLWGEAVPTYAWGSMASLGYYGGAGAAIHTLDIDEGGIAMSSGTLGSDGQTIVENSSAIMGVEGLGTAFVTAPNGFYLNGKLQSEYDWSDWTTENTTDTWVPVSTGSGKMQHRVIPSNEFTTQTSGIFRKRGKIVMVNFYGTSVTSLPTVPSGYRPPSDISIPITVMYNGNPYMGYVQIRANGNIQCTYYNYGSGKGTPVSGSTIYGETTWIID